jgi:hypothetical protein
MQFPLAARQQAISIFTLFLPGLESMPAGALPRMPALERLLARCRVQTLDASPWGLLARQAGGELGRWPVGPVSALGDSAHAVAACLRIEPLGADPRGQGAFGLPASRLEIRDEEARSLAAAFREVFDGDGLRLEIATPRRWYLAWDDVAVYPGWSGFQGPWRTLADGDRPGPPEPGLRRLLSEVEMLFHAHPVNAARRGRGEPLIAGLHPWGGGMLAIMPAGAASRLSPAGEEPWLAGLRRLGAVGGAARASADDAAVDPGVAWPVAIEDVGPERFARVEASWAQPLLERLAHGRLAAVRIVTARAVHETTRFGLLRAWRRPRPASELC